MHATSRVGGVRKESELNKHWMRKEQAISKLLECGRTRIPMN